MENKEGDSKAMEDYKVEQMKAMLAHEENPEEVHYGATLKHWAKDSKPILIDAGGIRALIEYYSTHDAHFE